MALALGLEIAFPWLWPAWLVVALLEVNWFVGSLIEPGLSVLRPRGHLFGAGRLSAATSLFGRKFRRARGSDLARRLQGGRQETTMQPVPMSWFRTAIAVALASGLAACARAEAAPKADPENALDASSLTTVEVVERSFPKTLLLTGSLAPNQSSSIAADAAGKVIETFVERGTAVRRGQVLVRLDASEAALGRAEAQASVDAARTQEHNAKLECERAERLFAKEVISRAAYDQAKAGCDGAGSNLDAASVRASRAAKKLGDSLVRAPFSGVIVERFVSVGEYVMPGSKIARIIQVDPMRVELSVPEVLSGKLSQGQSVSFTVASLPGERFPATVRYVGPALEDRSRNLTVEALIDRPDPRLKPGMFATTSLIVGQEKALGISERAIGGDRTSPRAWVLNAGRLEERVLSLGERDATMIVIRKGLARGERVVAEPSSKLQDGQRVR